MLYFLQRWWDQAYPPKSEFEPGRDVPDLTGKVIIVTGGNTGIGKETVKQLLLKNATVYLGARSRAKAETAIQDLKQETNKEAIFLELDLSSLTKVTAAAQEFKRKEKALHVLFNSAGVMMPPKEVVTDDGYDLQFSTNVLGPAHFTMLLLPELLEGAKTSPDGKARVVNTSSAVVYQTPPEPINWMSLKDGPERQQMDKIALYNQSRYGVLAFSNELARRYGDQGIISHAVNPGSIQSDLLRHVDNLVVRLIVWLTFSPVSSGALTQLYAGTSPAAATSNGGWFIPWARRYPHDKFTSNPAVEKKLWEWLEEQREDH